MKNKWCIFMALTLVSCAGQKMGLVSSPAEYPAKQGSLKELVYTPAESQFSVWSPGAKSVTLRIYATAEAEEPIKSLKMRRQEDGSWTATVKGDQKGRFYTFQVQQPLSRWQLHETPGIFATAVSVNGKRAAILDLRDTDPEGWQQDRRPAFRGAQDAIVYEMHHRDYSIHPSSGVQHRGKFLALTEQGTRSPEGLKTGIDHLVELGVTHVQILPSYDYASVDESHPEKAQYNWGYDPQNYNVPEGSYATDATDPACRIREMKQMIQALHKAGIRVIMDVVYNHTFDVENSAFTQTCPDYFYRLTADGHLGNASGCGNETASEREMMHRYIVESVRYWVEEYHLDGFRFDLMGIHDQATMMDVRRMLDSIDPSLLLYGEGWAAGSPLLDYDKLAMKALIKNMPGVGAFCDDMRDALRGPFSDDHQAAFLDGQPGHEESIKFGLVGCIAHPEVDMSKVNYSREPWTVQPTQSINYVSCHDDMMLTDRLRASVKLQDGELERLDKLAQTAVLTSQGIPFLWVGEEVMRDKKGVHNSYNSPDSINQIDWSLKAKNEDLFRYYQALIALRKAHPAFHLGDAELVRKHMHFLEAPQGVVAYVLTDHAGGDAWQDIVVVLNSNREAVTINLPDGKFTAVCADGQFTDDAKKTYEKKATIAPQTALILHD